MAFSHASGTGAVRIFPMLVLLWRNPCMAHYHQPCLAMKHGTLKGCRRHSLAGHQEEAKNCCKALALAADGQMPFWGHELQAIWYGRLWQGGSTPVSSKALSYMQSASQAPLRNTTVKPPIQTSPKQYLHKTQNFENKKTRVLSRKRFLWQGIVQLNRCSVEPQTS